MKTLILFGSARKQGHTREMMDYFIGHLGGEVEVIDAYRTRVAPCIDCRHCWQVKECSIDDGMQEIYRKLEEADNLIIASPIYFHTISGELKSLIDRFQIYWASYIRKDKPENYLRNGGMIFTGGAPEFKDQFLGGEIVVKNLLHDLDTDCLGMVAMDNTDRQGLEDRPELKKELEDLAQLLNKKYEDSLV